MLPTTPTAEIIRSAVISVALPSASTVAVTEFAPFTTLVTLALVMILRPCLSKALRANAEISASSTGRICGMTSTTVTSEPMPL